MNKLLASELGFLGINVDSNFDLAWLKTEVADKIREGDQTSIYRLINFARHSEDEDIRRYANIIANLYQDKVDAYGNIEVNSAQEDKEYDKVETIEEVVDVLNSLEEGEEVSIELTQDIDLTSGDIKSVVIPEGADVDIKIADGKSVTCIKEGFKVSSGASLTLSGTGTIVSTTSNANGAIRAEAGSTVNIDGVTIDCVSGKEDSTDNWAYGVYAVNSSTVNFKSGTIHVGGASCISTNNLTGGSDINISGGELLSDYGYAIYVPAQGNVNITGGKVQGINARMGNITISGDAEILSVGITDDTCESIGSNFNASGSTAVGDTIAILAGTYTDEKGTDTILTITGNAKVGSTYKSAIGIYTIDTKKASVVNVIVDKADYVTTSAEGYKPISVYDHTFISEAATEAGKSYTPKVDSTVTVTVDGEVIFPVTD